MWTCPRCGREFARNGQNHYCGDPPADIDDYIMQQPEEIRPALLQIRDAIRAAIPEAKETITWNMPNWKCRRNIIQFAANKKHVGLYPGEEAVAHFAEKLVGCRTNRGNIQLPFDKPMPLELISEIAGWCWKQDMEN